VGWWAVLSVLSVLSVLLTERGGLNDETRSVGRAQVLVVYYICRDACGNARRRTDDLDVASRADFSLGEYSGFVYFSSLDVMRMRWEPNWVFTGPKT